MSATPDRTLANPEQPLPICNVSLSSAKPSVTRRSNSRLRPQRYCRSSIPRPAISRRCSTRCSKRRPVSARLLLAFSGRTTASVTMPWGSGQAQPARPAAVAETPPTFNSSTARPAVDVTIARLSSRSRTAALHPTSPLLPRTGAPARSVKSVSTRPCRKQACCLTRCGRRAAQSNCCCRSMQTPFCAATRGCADQRPPGACATSL